MARQLTTAKILATKERRAYVISLRKAGATYRQIAQAAIHEFGRENLPKNYDERQAHLDVKREIAKLQRRIKDDLTEYRWFQVERYESIIRAHWTRAMTGLALGCTDRVLKAMKDQNKLLGLDAPTQVDMRVLQIDARIDKLLETVAGRTETETTKALGSGGNQEEDTIVEGTARYL